MLALALLACVPRDPPPPPPVPVAAPTVWVALPAAASMGKALPLSLEFRGAQVPSYVEVSCDNGFRERASLVEGRAEFPSVPVGSPCTAFPKGLVATSLVVKGGQRWGCEMVGTTTSCQAASP